jgi:acyl dehydratase
MPVASLDEIISKVGSHIGTSPWVKISQRDIDQFADVTKDHQFIHVDPERAGRTPFGSTVAHGFFTLALLPQMAEDVMYFPESLTMSLNYGLERLRFIAPVRPGKRIRASFTLKSMEEKHPGQWQFLHNVVVEIEGENKPALIADWIGYIFV